MYTVNTIRIQNYISLNDELQSDAKIVNTTKSLLPPSLPPSLPASLPPSLPPSTPPRL